MKRLLVKFICWLIGFGSKKSDFCLEIKQKITKIQIKNYAKTTTAHTITKIVVAYK